MLATPQTVLALGGVLPPVLGLGLCLRSRHTRDDTLVTTDSRRDVRRDTLVLTRVMLRVVLRATRHDTTRHDTTRHDTTRHDTLMLRSDKSEEESGYKTE